MIKICPDRAYHILLADLIGLKFNNQGMPDHTQVSDHIEAKGGVFHLEGLQPGKQYQTGKLHFFYLPGLSQESELLEHTAKGQYDALIVAATFIPAMSRFDFGAVRIGAGTGNMASISWGGSNGQGGIAPLMNTPSYNSRATAQMAFKALLKVCPNLPVEQIHQQVVAGQFDTGKHLRDYPSEKLESKRIAVLGFGNIGQEMAKLAKAFGMTVVVYARKSHRQWIESLGYRYAHSPQQAACGADIISVHTGLGAFDAQNQRYANQQLISAKVLNAMQAGAIVINYDRGELIDIQALDQALMLKQISYAAIDADTFIDDKTGRLFGPMQPYLALQSKYPGKLALLPHCAADTEHWSRVQGAIQAVEQLYSVIEQKSVVNLVGDLPKGYSNGGDKTALGIGKVRPQHICDVANNAQSVQQLSFMAKQMHEFWAELAGLSEQQKRTALAEKQGEQLMLNINHYITQLEALGLRGPFDC